MRRVLLLCVLAIGLGAVMPLNAEAGLLWWKKDSKQSAEKAGKKKLKAHKAHKAPKAKSAPRHSRAPKA